VGKKGKKSEELTWRQESNCENLAWNKTDSDNNSTNSTNGTVLGGDRDGFGCLQSGGYVFCHDMRECVQPWMTNCSNLANATNSTQRLPDPDLFSGGEYSPAADHDQRHDRDGPKTLLFIGAIVAAIIVIPASELPCPPALPPPPPLALARHPLALSTAVHPHGPPSSYLVAAAFLIGHYMGRRAAPIRRAVTSYGNLEV